MKQVFTLLAAVLLTASTCAQVGIGTTTPDASSALDITSNTKGLLIPRMTTAQRDAISSAAKGLIVFNTTLNTLQINEGDATTANWVSLTSAATHAIGDSYGGGIVFYVWDNGNHGLIVAKDEIGSLGPANFTSTSGVIWSKNTTTTYGAYRSGLGGGDANTNLMISKTTTDGASQWYNYAQNSTADFYSAYVAQQYRRVLQANEVRYGDWYLPSRGELEYLYTNKDNIAGSGYDPTHTYWSSTETNDSYAYILNTNGTGTTNTGSGPGSNTWSTKSSLHFVLPIRSF
jgi:hypothetical protein|tara:strand:+ start:168 stop:1031 length:864 start_codon:yes stop_codon:yes gene_type:complete